MTEWNQLMTTISGHQEIILLVHDKPDGDCLGSALALAFGLDQLGYEPKILLPEAIPEIYRFLPGQQFIEIRTASMLSGDKIIIAVDCSDKSRLNYIVAEETPIINIDHHVSNDCFGQLNIVRPKAAAAGEIVFGLLQEAHIKITADMATCLYVAISTDTGSFIYSNTSAKSLQIASELLLHQADLSLIRSELHEKRPLTELLTIKAALSNLYLSEDKRIIACFLTHDELKEKNLLTTETDGLIGMLRATEGVEIALLFKELQPGTIKVSLRSKSVLDVNKLASEFNGGGHARAAGCTITGSMDEVRQLVLRKTAESLQGMFV